MAITNGYICLHRALMEKPIWLNSTPEQKTIFITILLLANYSPKQWEWQGKKFNLKAGQFITSLDKLAEKCGKGITCQHIRTALGRFEKLEFLTNQSTKTGRLITIVNWEQYQDSEKQSNKDTNKDLTDNSQTANKDLTTNNNNKNNKNKNICANKNQKKLNDENFNLFWEAYPKKRSKEQAYKAFLKVSPDADLLATMLNKIRIFENTSDWQEKNGQYIPYPATWLNGKCWEDEISVSSSFQDDGLPEF